MGDVNIKFLLKANVQFQKVNESQDGLETETVAQRKRACVGAQNLLKLLIQNTLLNLTE